MVSDLNTANPLKFLMIATVAAVVFTVVLVMLYLSLRQASFSKTQPYSIQLQVEAVNGGELSAEYNYGYGYNAGHQQLFGLVSSTEPQTVSFTVSAWKALRSLRFSSQSNLNINQVVIKQGLAEHQAFDSETKNLSEGPLEIAYIKRELLRQN